MVIFTLCNFCSSTLANSFTPSSICQDRVVFKERMGVNISLYYTVFATMRLWSQTSLLNVCNNNTGVDKAFRLKNSCSKFSSANGGKKVANEINRFTVNVFVFLDITPNLQITHFLEQFSVRMYRASLLQPTTLFGPSHLI